MRNDGGPAFPFVEQSETESGHVVTDRVCKGMSLRDWFAGQAHRELMEATWAVYKLHDATDPETSAQGMQAALATAAQLHYQWADAMLREKAKREAP